MSVADWQERLYPAATRVSTHQAFLSVLESHLDPRQTVLDLGAGAGELNGYRLRGRVKRVVGIDLDERVKTNPLLDEGLVGDLCKLPFPDRSFDLAFSIYVLEHIADPDRFAAEVSRVLKPGGLFLCLTPNMYHYVPAIAALTPYSFHKWINAKRGRDEDDTFPTFYRLNSRRALTRHFGRHGCAPVAMKMVEPQPNYLMFTTPTFLLGAAYERLVNSTDLLAGLRVNLIGVLRKEGQPEANAPQLPASRAA